jgi:HAE1 family hydrophobic/amphiphilic exporter-1
MIYLIIAVIGSFAYLRLRIDLFPDIDFPAITIVASYPGVAPEEMETLVTRPIEEAVSRVEGVNKIESNSSEGRSRVVLSFDWGTSLSEAFNDVQAAIERGRARMPEDVPAPTVYKFDITNVPVMVLALDAEGDEGELRRFAEDVVKPRLERISGVASADISGARLRELRVSIDPLKLADFRLSTSQVIAAIRNASPLVPTGAIGQEQSKLLVRAMGEFESVEQLSNIVVTRRNGHAIRLSELAVVEDSFEDRVSLVRIDNQEGVSLRVVKTSSANTIELADRLQQEITAFNEEYDGRARLSVIVDTSVFIRRSVDGVKTSIGYGALLAFCVLLFFLRSLRSTMVIGTVIPVAMLATLFMMDQLDLTLNLITFGGLALGMGMLVDSSIVILENIFRKREQGEDAREAAIQGASEVAMAIVASTLTTVVVFVPVVFLQGFIAIFFQQMALVVICALLASLMAALTLTPMMSYLMLRRMKHARAAKARRRGPIALLLDGLDAVYARLLRFALRIGPVVLLLAVAGVVLAGMQAGDIGQEFFPDSDESEVRVSADYPAGTRLERTDAAAVRMSAAIREWVPEAQSILTVSGTGGNYSSAGEESTSLRINLSPVTQRQRSSQEIASLLQRELPKIAPGMRISARAGGGLWIMRAIRGGDERVRVELRGFDLEIAEQLSEKIADLMMSVEGVSDARSSRRVGGTELRLYMDRDKLGILGASPSELAETISTLVQGTRAAVFREAGHEYEVRVRLPELSRENLDVLLNAPVSFSGARPQLLRELVQVKRGPTPQAIERLNQERIVVISGGLDGSRDLAAVNADIAAGLASLELPDGFSAIVAGEDEQQQKGFGDLSMGFLLALLLVYMVMAAQFESLLQPLIIMASVPFAAIGVIGALLVTGTTLNVYSFLGAIVLIGIVVNNGIVLVDYTNLLLRTEGLGLRESVLEAARRRLRPILMTTSTTILALLPVAMSTGTGAESQAPLARVVVGGVGVSTLVTLFVVPILYYGLGKASRWWTSRRVSTENVHES